MQKELTLDELKTQAEIIEIVERARKQATERAWYPIVIGAALLGAGAAFGKLFL